MSTETVMAAARRSVGISDSDRYKRGNRDLFTGIAKDRQALNKRAREIMRTEEVGESYAMHRALKERDEALELRRSERNRAVYEQMAQQNKRQAEDNLRSAQERASVGRVRYQFNGDPEPGASVNDVIYDQARDTMSEKVWVYLHGGREALRELEGK